MSKKVHYCIGAGLVKRLNDVPFYFDIVICGEHKKYCYLHELQSSCCKAKVTCKKCKQRIKNEEKDNKTRSSN